MGFVMFSILEEGNFILGEAVDVVRFVLFYILILIRILLFLFKYKKIRFKYFLKQYIDEMLIYKYSISIVLFSQIPPLSH